MMRKMDSKRLQSRKNPPWSDLPQEILGCIMEHLCFVDQIRFRAVCKSWHRIRGVKPSWKFPWLLIFKDGRYFGSEHYYLLNLHTRKTYTLQNNVKHQCSNPICDVDIRCSGLRSGWLVLKYWLCNVHLLFNAFTQEVINLPRLEREQSFLLFAFSIHVEAPHFVVYCAEWVLRDEQKVSINVWHSGEKEWESRDYRLGVYSDGRILGLKCIGGKLFCVFRSGAVGVFDDAIKSWSMVVNPENPRTPEMLKLKFLPHPMVIECEEELFILQYAWSENRSIFRLDLAKRRWVEEASMDRHLLFCFESPYPFRKFFAMLSGREELQKDLAGHIYYHDRDFDCICSVEYNKATLTGIDQVNVFYGDAPVFRQRRYHLRSGRQKGNCVRGVWIEPPTI